jgi:hypothetical protein
MTQTAFPYHFDIVILIVYREKVKLGYSVLFVTALTSATSTSPCNNEWARKEVEDMWYLQLINGMIQEDTK